MKGRRNEEKNEGKEWGKMKGKERKERFSLINFHERPYPRPPVQ
ncbi:16182_t:CDS:2, partial [Rhizophagus irregularis]